ncbi:MAG: NUDIX domain-containing protein [Patescibacteria group bacterium]
MPVEKSAGIIVFYKEDDGEIKYLLLKHKPDSWDFPKGLVEKGEKPEDAAVRECKEETGIEIKELIFGFKETIRFFFKVKYEYQIKRGFKIGQTVLKFVTYFLAMSETKDVRISFEHEGYEWLTFDEIINRLKKRKESQRILGKANNFLKEK